MGLIERSEVVVVGGGQAGLAAAYELSRRGLQVVVLDASDRIGDSWRKRWDSLRLFTPARYNGLPGFAFPADPDHFPTKDEMGDYLERYVQETGLEVRSGTRASALERRQGRLLLITPAGEITAEHVVLATGAHQAAIIPALGRDLDPSIRQLRAAEYRSADQFAPGPVLVVGAGTSGTEIAIEAAQAGHKTLLSGRAVGQIPPFAFAFGGRIWWFIASRLLSRGWPLGRRILGKMRHGGAPLIRISLEDVRVAGVQIAPRLVATQDGRPVLADGRVLSISNVVWCTGFEQDFSWVHLPAFAGGGLPEHDRGAVVGEPGVHLIGVPLMTRMISAFVGGAAGDASDLAKRVAGTRRSAPDGTHFGADPTPVPTVMQ